MRKGFGFALLVAALGTFFVTGGPAYADCGSPTNAIEAENCLPGNPPSEWDVSGAGDRNLQAFATDVGVNRGETISFKVSTTATAYHIDIYRLGYYGGDGARKVATIPDTLTAKTSQPPCLTDKAGLVNCGNWSVSASWAVPARAVSGIYVARLVGEAGVTGASHVTFVVRHDGGTSDLLFQTTDATSLFQAEYPMVRWLERNGYDVSYFTGVDAERRGHEILGHRVYLSVGRDERWSDRRRSNIEAARDHTPPVHLAFFGSQRGATRESAKGDPENALTGTMFNADGGQSAIQVPEADGKMRFWRDTPTVATLAPGAAWTGPQGTLGREWGEDLDNGARPAGLVRLSTRAGAAATHHAVFHRRPNGALVFASGTRQWSWGLDGVHEGVAASPSADMQQATVNLFADMGVQAATLQAGLVPASASVDVVAPVSDITSPADGAAVSAFTPVIIQGTAADGLPGLVGGVEVSVDGGATWHAAEGRGSWSYVWTPAANGSYALLSRAVDDSGNLETPSVGRVLSVGRDASRYAARAPRTRDFDTAVAGTFTDNLLAEFSLGTPDANIVVTAAPDGEVQLANVAGSAEFDVVPANWTSTPWPAGTPVGPVTVAGGQLVVDGALANTVSGLTYGPGTTIEFVATFGAAGFQNVGFGAGIDGDIFNNTPPAAMFGTSNDGTQVLARVWTSGPFQDVALGALVGAPHTYKIVWQAAGFEFYVDNVLLHAQATPIAGPMRAAVSDFTPGAPAVSVDWLHVLSHPSPGTFVSRVFDSTATTTSWKAMTWTADVPPGTALAMYARIGTASPPSGAWIPISSSGTILGGTARYVQYRAVLSTTNRLFTPVLRRVDVAYDTIVADTTPPTILSRTPLASATGVPVGTTVVVQFNEVMNAGTITTSTFRLRAAGSSSDVAATVILSGNIATLTPVSALSSGTNYTVTVSATVADLSGNPLGTDAVWTFTTAMPSFTDTTVANFLAARASTCAAGSYESGGDVILAPFFGSGFDGAALPAGWVVTPWTGGTGTVSGGLLNVDGARVDSGATFYPVGRALEFVATFGAETSQHVGLGFELNLLTESWAMFGTAGSTSSLYARTNNGAGSIDVAIPGSWIGSPHRYRIEWAVSEVRFYVDGTLLHTAPITIAVDLRPVVSDYQLGGTTLAVGGLRVSPFTSPCTLESRVFDAAQPVTWSSLSWTADVPTGTALAMSARSGSTSVPDGTWTSWTLVAAPGSTNAGIGRYGQYQAILSASDTARTPVLSDATLSSSPAPSYTLTVTAPTNGTITGTGINCGTGGIDCTETYNYGTVVALTATPATGYSFAGWTGACTGTTPCTVTMTAARTVGATFTILRYALTVTTPTNGTITGTGINCGTGGVDCTETYDYGTVVPLTATPDTGFALSAWTGACTGAGPCSLSMTAARTVGATFAIQRLTLTVTAPTHGTITATGINCGLGGTDCTEAYDYGTVVPLTAIPETGYDFGAWTGACTGAGPCSLSMTAARTVGATFTIQRYTLTVTTPTNGAITGAGIACGAGGTDCTETYDYATVVPLTATPATGYGLSAWTGACSGAGACTLSMTAARTVGATFTILRYTLTVTTPAHGRITAAGITCGTGGTDCTETYDYGTVVSLTATPDTGYRLRAWTGACTGIGACSVTMTAARTVGGLFSLTFQLQKGDPNPYTGPELILNAPAARRDATPEVVTDPLPPLESGPASAPGPRLEPIAVPKSAPEPKAETRQEPRPDLGPRDSVSVPDVPRVVVTGEVRNPGTYAWFPGMTARQLIFAAGGLTPDASEGVLFKLSARRVPGAMSMDDPVPEGETLAVLRQRF